MLTPYQRKFFRLCILISIFLPCWKYAKKDDRSHPSKCRLIALLSCLSKHTEMNLNIKIHKHLSHSKLVSYPQNGLSKRRSTGYLFAFLNNFWLSSLSCLGEVCCFRFIESFCQSQTKVIQLKLPNYELYISLCIAIYNLLSSSSIYIVVDGHFSLYESINSDVLQRSVISILVSMTLLCSTPFFHQTIHPTEIGQLIKGWGCLKRNLWLCYYL